MSFADWKKRSKVIPNAWHGKPYTDIDRALQAAYKAGEREGRKQALLMAEQAIKLRNMLNAVPEKQEPVLVQHRVPNTTEWRDGTAPNEWWPQRYLYTLEQIK